MTSSTWTLRTPTQPTGGSKEVIPTLPIVVLFPHNRCNCRCVMCDIWRIREVREITATDLEPHLASFRALKVRWAVFSGGEPLMHSDLAALGRMLRAESIRVTLLTTGLLVGPNASLVADTVDDVILSLDGPPEIHDRIRRVAHTFDRLAEGVAAVRSLRPDFPISARCTVQKANHRNLRETVKTAQELRLQSVSFLAADVTSEAFNRPGGWGPERQRGVALDTREVDELDHEVEALIREYSEEIASGFIAESADKLRRIVFHFRAILGQVKPTAPRCNAPWVSAVIEADGQVRPCFFHPSLGNLHDASLAEVLNGPVAREFRKQLDIPTNPVCQKCVCSLYLPEA